MAAIIHSICCILVGIVFLSVAKSEFSVAQLNETNHASRLELSGRSKRFLYAKIPKKLKIRIKYVTGEYTDLKLSTTDQFLANGHLPITAPNADISANVMKDVDEFVMYHDVANCAAVVYFKKTKALYGVIGVDYYIQNLRLEFNEFGQYQLGEVTEPFLQKREHPSLHIHPENVFPPPSDTNAWEDFLRQPYYDLDPNRERTVSCDAGPSTQYQRTHQDLDESIRTNMGEYSISNIGNSGKKNCVKRYYLETLVFVTRDIVETFKEHFGRDTYIEWIVRYYIIYFNSVDMTFKRFTSQPDLLQINIAKIVIENDIEPFDFISNDELQFTDIIEKLQQYLYAHRDDYAPDSFDYVFIHTSRVIMDDIIPINGLSKLGKNLYEARKNNQFYDVVPITVVRYQTFFADYVVAAHEVGRILNIKIDSQIYGLTFMGQCHGVMQREGPKCLNCLNWSYESDVQFNEFFRTNRNRCFLLNEPRSLRPPGPSRFSTPQRQCLCFGYDSHITNFKGKPSRKILVHQCADVLRCQISDGTQLHVEPTVRPFDGTLCGGEKVCWNGKCIQYSPFRRASAIMI